MQLYQGLPVITNKITDEEKKGIPHHLLGCIGLEHETWTVGKFVSNALAVVCMVIFVHVKTLTSIDPRDTEQGQASDPGWWYPLLHPITLVPGRTLK
jgi:hypothetical protein